MKAKLRQEILEARRTLPESFVKEAEKKVFTRLLESDIFKNASHVMIYVDFQNEIRTKKIIEYLLDVKKDVVVPLISKDKSKIIPVKIGSPEELSLGHFGIHEPKNESNIFSKDLLDLIIVPGVVFDKAGNRIGFGKGYYDGFLSSLKGKVPFIALAYDFQVLESIPSGSHDVKMDYILTPDQLIKIDN